MVGGDIGDSEVESLYKKLMEKYTNLSSREWDLLDAIFLSGVDAVGNITETPGADAVATPGKKTRKDMVKQLMDENPRQRTPPP